MNQHKRQICFSLAALALGIAGAGLRGALYAFAIDEKGLLIPHHPAAIAVWLLALAGILLTFVAGRGTWKYNRTPDSARRNIFTGLCEILLGAAVYASVSMNTLPGLPVLIPVRKILGAVCMAALINAGMFHLFGKKVPFYCPAVASAFFLINALTCYPAWSRDPQLMDYAFSLGAELCLCLFSYYQAALSLELPGRKQRAVFGILGLFFCCAAIPGDFTLIHAAGAVYLLSVLLTGREERL